MDFKQHLRRQAAFSLATFGPGERTAGLINHIKKEIAEIEAEADPFARADEWTDVAILALDGLMRAVYGHRVRSADPRRISCPEIAHEAALRIYLKQIVNEARIWPDWRAVPEGVAIEHIRDAGAPL